MNRTIIALVAVVALASQPAAADGPHEWGGHSWAPRNVLILNAGDLLNGTVSLEYEVGLAYFLGLEFGLSVLAFRGVFNPPVTAQVIAVAPEVGLRFHFIRNAPGGLWIGPSLNAAYIGGTNPPRVYGFGFGAAVGYNFIFSHFVLQLGVGGAVLDYGEGFVWSPHFRVGLGVAF